MNWPSENGFKVNLNIYILHPISGTELLKTLGIPRDENNKSVSCYVNEVIFGKHLRLGAGCQEHQASELRGWNFHSQLSPCREGTGLEFESVTNGQ